MQSGEAKVPSAPLDHLSIHATATAEFCGEFNGRSDFGLAAAHAWGGCEHQNE